MKVAVFSGGISEERQVSLASGQAVCAAFQEAGWEAVSVEITQNGLFLLPGHPPLSPQAGMDRLFNQGVQVAFPALHGPYGEDGIMQGFLTTVGMPYTGPDPQCAAVTMDKHITKMLLSEAGVTVPRGVLLRQGMPPEKAVPPFPPPWVVKPNSLGSSIGVYFVHEAGELPAALESVWALQQNALVEERIEGIEYSCPVITTKDGLEALPVIEIRPAPGRTFFDYVAKYQSGQAEEIVHLDADPLYARMQQAALTCHDILGCRHFSRTDFILSGQEPMVLEINTIPGLTNNSLLPKSAQAAGFALSDVVTAAAGQACEELSMMNKTKARKEVL